jgi:hypothetical protein
MAQSLLPAVASLDDLEWNSAARGKNLLATTRVKR